jgi:5-methylcytosine-specific restriction enzyme A
MPQAAKPFFKSRPPAHKRGYDKAWAKLRAAYVKAHPHCERCLLERKQVATAIVDHQQPFNGLNDPLRMLWSNLESQCRSCHALKTNRDKAAGLTTRYKQAE